MSDPRPADEPAGALHLAVRRAALDTPDREAIGTHDRRLTVGELAARAGALTERLADGGTAPFLLAPVDAVELAIGLVAASASGRAALVADPRRAPSALVAFAGPAGATTAVIGAAASLGLPSVHPGSLGDGTLTSDVPDPDAVLLLAGTSGSTAAPKLVGHTHRSVADRAARRGGAGDILPDDRVGRTFNHTGATTQSIVASLLLAVPVLALDLLRVAPSTVLRRFHEARSTHVRLVPSVLRRLLAATPPDVRLPHVRLIGGGGDPMHWEDVARLRPLLSAHATIIHSYGSTEVHGIARRYLTMDEPLGEGVVPVGRPGPGRHVWIDRGDGRPADPGVVGEIVVEGRFHAVGPAFEELGDGIKRRRTRDLGELTPDGELIHRGRVDRMVKIGGVRVEPEAVESVLRTLPGVQDVAVVPVGDAADRRRLVAHLVIEPGKEPDVAELRAAVADRVTSVAVPAAFHLRSGPLPLLASGKVDRRALGAEDAQRGTAP